MDNFIVWDIASKAWTEIGLDDGDYPVLAKELKARYSSWNEVDQIILRDVCWSFSVESTSMIFALIPIVGLFLITPMPDWGYDEEYLRKRVKVWGKKPLIIKFLNPLRIVGYPIALMFTFGLRNKLKKAYYAANTT